MELENISTIRNLLIFFNGEFERGINYARYVICFCTKDLFYDDDGVYVLYDVLNSSDVFNEVSNNVFLTLKKDYIMSTIINF